MPPLSRPAPRAPYLASLRRRLIWGALAIAAAPFSSYADLRLTFSVELNTDIPEREVPKTAATHESRAFTLSVVLGADYLTSNGDETSALIDFAGRKIYQLHPRDKTYQISSLFSDLGFREAEFRNRLMLQKALSAGGIKENPFDTVLMEHLFALGSPAAETLSPVEKTKALVYAQGAKPLFSGAIEGTAISADAAKSFARFLRYAYAVHPDILKTLEEGRVVPAHFETHRYNQRVDHYRFTLTKTEPVARSFAPDQAVEGWKRLDSDVAALSASAAALSSTQFEAKCSELIALGVAEAKNGHHLNALLLFLEYVLSNNAKLPPEFMAHKASIERDPEVRTFLEFSNALAPKEAASKAAEIMKQLQTPTRKGLAVLKIHEANLRTAAGHPEAAVQLFHDALRASPWIVGAWKDLGDLYYQRYDAVTAWECWDTGRRLGPTHSLFRQVNQFEQRMLDQYPEFF